MDASFVGQVDRLCFLGAVIASGPTAGIERRLLPRLGLLLSLGSLRVPSAGSWSTSGLLPDSTAVSPYRLVIHLALALLLYAAVGLDWASGPAACHWPDWRRKPHRCSVGWLSPF